MSNSVVTFRDIEGREHHINPSSVSFVLDARYISLPLPGVQTMICYGGADCRTDLWTPETSPILQDGVAGYEKATVARFYNEVVAEFKTAGLTLVQFSQMTPIRSSGFSDLSVNHERVAHTRNGIPLVYPVEAQLSHPPYTNILFNAGFFMLVNDEPKVVQKKLLQQREALQAALK